MTLKELWGHGPVITRGGRVGWYVGVRSGDFKKVIFSDSLPKLKLELGPTFITPTQKLKQPKVSNQLRLIYPNWAALNNLAQSWTCWVGQNPWVGFSKYAQLSKILSIIMYCCVCIGIVTLFWILANGKKWKVRSIWCQTPDWLEPSFFLKVQFF